MNVAGRFVRVRETAWDAYFAAVSARRTEAIVRSACDHCLVLVGSLWLLAIGDSHFVWSTTGRGYAVLLVAAAVVAISLLSIRRARQTYLEAEVAVRDRFSAPRDAVVELSTIQTLSHSPVAIDVAASDAAKRRFELRHPTVALDRSLTRRRLIGWGSLLAVSLAIATTAVPARRLVDRFALGRSIDAFGTFVVSVSGERDNALFVPAGERTSALVTVDGPVAVDVEFVIDGGRLSSTDETESAALRVEIPPLSHRAILEVRAADCTLRTIAVVPRARPTLTQANIGSFVVAAARDGLVLPSRSPSDRSEATTLVASEPVEWG